MTGEERGKVKGSPCEAVEGGYTIFLDEERIRSFMGGGDFSSASELGHFKDVGAQIEKRIKERGGAALLALSIGEKRLSRDFAALEIAHILAQHGKSVLIVDCDFLHPGLSGLVESLEEQGFLDLLLYGSSLKTVARPLTIEGVSITGAGSFPVSRTIPFALKEFEKIREFLRVKHDVVIYCSTLHTEDAKLNPLIALVDGIVLCCRIEEMPEGELQKSLALLSAEKVSPVELVCFCGKREQAHAAAAPKTLEKKAEPPKISLASETHREQKLPTAHAIETEEGPEPVGTTEGGRKPRFSLLRVASLAVAILIAAFVIWWFMISRTVREKEGRGTISSDVAESREAGAPTKEPASAVIPPESTTSVPAAGIETPPAEAAARTAERPAATEAKSPLAERTEGAARREQTPPGAPLYTIHVASFKEMTRANVEKAYLEKNGFATRIVEVEIKGEKWLRILVGEYATMDEASQARLNLLGLNMIGYARITTVGDASR